MLAQVVPRFLRATTLPKIVNTAGKYYAANCVSSRKFMTPESMAMHGTTILAIRKNNKVVMIGDGQVSMGNTVVKSNARKVRRIGTKSSVLAGFAGATADAFALFERLEGRLDEHPGQLMRACVELAKAWRTDKYLRPLQALIIVADVDITLMISGNGDVVEPQDGVMAIGSGGLYALAAARALMDIEGLDAEEIARRAMKIAGDICVMTNHNVILETLDCSTSSKPPADAPTS